MKIYDFAGAPNPKKVRMYLAEKGIDDMEIVAVDITKGEHRTEEFRAKNPRRKLPVLELDDGRCFSESLAIIEYLEECYPDPPLIGRNKEERLHVRRLERICELGVLYGVSLAVQNSHPFFAKQVQQSEDTFALGMRLLNRNLSMLDEEMGTSPFVAGEQISIADCTLYAALWFAHVMRAKPDLSACPNLRRWNDAMRQRPSAKA